MSLTPTPPLIAEPGGGLDPIPLAVAAALVLGLAVQLALPPSPPPVISAAAARTLPLRAATASVPPLAPPDPVILARPLFSQTRSVVALQAAAPVGALSLLGVGLSRSQALATVQDGSGALHTVRPGEAVQGWRLQAVGRDRASFARDGVAQTLRVGAGPAAAAPGAAAATARR